MQINQRTVSGGLLEAADKVPHAHNNNNTPPALDDQGFQFIAAPNHFNLADFFELHVWAWQDNPLGAFVERNDQVSCEGQ